MSNPADGDERPSASDEESTSREPDDAGSTEAWS
jgi:hypothetical protein